MAVKQLRFKGYYRAIDNDDNICKKSHYCIETMLFSDSIFPL